MGISANAVALAGIGGTVVGSLGGAALGYYGQLRTAKARFTYERQLAEEQRLWDKRAVEYPEFFGKMMAYKNAVWRVATFDHSAKHVEDVTIQARAVWNEGPKAMILIGRAH